MTIRTALVIAGDSKDAQKAVADLNRAIEQAEGEAKAYATALRDTDASIGRLAVTQAAAKRETDQAKAALAAGEITVEEYNRRLLETRTALGLVQDEHRQHVAVLRQTKQAYDLTQVSQDRNNETMKVATASAGMQRAGMQQLSFQIADVGASYAVGIKPMVIFAQQGTQVIQALALMSGGAGKLAGFLTGGWGFALMSAVSVVGIFSTELLRAEDAIEKVEFASDAMADAQRILGGVMDLTTGKIKTQSAALIALARAQLVAGRVEAQREQAEARREMRSIRKGKVELQGGMMGGLRLARTGDASADVVSAFQDGSLNIKEAERGLASLLRTGQITEESYLRAADAVTQFGVAAANVAHFSEAEKALSGDAQAIKGFLNESSGGRKARSGGGRSRKSSRSAADEQARIEGRHLSELAQLNREELRARLDLTTDLETERDLRMELLSREREERERQIRSSEEFSAEQKAAQLAFLDTLFGKQTPLGDDESGVLTVNGPGLIQRAELARLREREMAMAIEMEAMQAETLSAQAAVAMGLDERAALEDRALQLQHAIEAKLLEQDIAQGRILDAEKARALLAERQAADREGVRQSRRGPLEQYVDDMNRGPAELREEGERLIVAELEHFRNGMRDAITNRLGIEDPFLAGVIDMFIQQMIIGPLAEALQNASGGIGGGGIIGGLFSLFGFGGGRAEGGPVSPGQIYAVNERSTAPGLFLPLAPGRIDPPAHAGGRQVAGGTGAPPVMQFDLRGAVVTADLLKQMNAIARQTAAGALAQYDDTLWPRIQKKGAQYG